MPHRAVRRIAGKLLLKNPKLSSQAAELKAEAILGAAKHRASARAKVEKI